MNQYIDLPSLLQMLRKPTILEYVRDKHRKKIGVMIAFVATNNDEDDRILIGWSKCKVRGKKEDTDTFNRDRGIYIAVHRAEKYFDYNYDSLLRKEKAHLPHSMRIDFERFINKCKNYYTKNGSKYTFPTFVEEISPTEGK